jgi:hypothetical protein
MTHLSKLIALVVILSSIALPITAKGQKGSRGFDPDGSFWIIGDPPNDFSDFSGINLNAKGLRRLPSAGVELNTGKRLRFKTLSVSRAKMTFTTVTLAGVSYSFVGRFLKGGVYAATGLDEETPVLEGVLTKLKNGQKVADAQLKFGYFGGT